MLAQCTSKKYSLNKQRMMRLAEYSRDVLRELRAREHLNYEQRSLGTLQLFRSQAQFDAAARDVEVLKHHGVPFELLGRDELARAEPALARVKRQAERRPAPAERRNRRLPCLHATARGPRSRARRRVPFRHRRHRTGGRGRALRRCAHRRRASRGRSLRRRARLPLDRLVEAARHRAAGLSGEGLFADASARRRIPRAGVDRARRDLQGRRDPLRQSHPRRRHGRARGLRSVAEAATAQDARDGGRGSVSRRRCAGTGRVLDRPAADDARQHADRRCDRGRPLVLEHRPRHAWLDDGGRIRPLHCRPDDGPAPGHRPRRARHRSLSGRDGGPGGSLDSPHEPSGAHPHRSRCAASQLPVAAPSTRWPRTRRAEGRRLWPWRDRLRTRAGGMR